MMSDPIQQELRGAAKRYAAEQRERLVETRHVIAAMVEHPDIRRASDRELPSAAEVLGDEVGVEIRDHHEFSRAAEQLLDLCDSVDAAVAQLRRWLSSWQLFATPAVLERRRQAAEDRLKASWASRNTVDLDGLEDGDVGPSEPEPQSITVTLFNQLEPGSLRVVTADGHPHVRLEWVGPFEKSFIEQVINDRTERIQVYRPTCDFIVKGAEPFELRISAGHVCAVLRATYVPAPGERIHLELAGHRLSLPAERPNNTVTASHSRSVTSVVGSSAAERRGDGGESGRVRTTGLRVPAGASSEQRAAFSEGAEALERLVGLDETKRSVEQLLDRAQVMQLRREHGLEVPESSRHLVFLGAPGTGKTEVARIYAKLLFGLGLLDTPTTVEVGRPQMVGVYAGQTAKLTTDVVKESLGGVLFIDEAYSLVRDVGDISLDYGAEAIDTLLKLMEDHRDHLTVIAAGYPDLMEKFLEFNPGLRSRFSQRIRFNDFSDVELAEIFVRMAERSDYVVPDDLRAAVERHYSGVQRTPSFGNGRAVRNLFEAAVVQQATRVVDIEWPSRQDLMELTESDVFPQDSSAVRVSESGLDSALDALDAMVGLRPVKTEIHQMVAVVRANAARRAHGLSAASAARHLVFTGPPGTGKTTVAGHLARALRSLGVVDRGHLVAVTKADLVAEWQGQTPVKTRAVVQRAMDGVLFIDEAYSLVGGERDSYGRESVEMLLKMMEDHRERLVVIVAGYPDEMDLFLNSNPGLRSRFTKRLEFPSYSTDELVEIFARSASNESYELGDGVLDAVRDRITAVGNSEEFGNGRGVRNLFQDAVMHLATRIDPATATREELTMLRPDDIGDPEPGSGRRRIGFR